MTKQTFENRPEHLAIPENDGAAEHLVGLRLPKLELTATDDTTVNLEGLGGVLVLYAYPMTGQPGVPLPNGWDEIPGARGCTPQSCAFRDHMSELCEAGANHVFGISTQTTDYQKEAAARMHLPFLLLSDSALRVQSSLNLPSMQASLPEQNNTLLKRLALVAKDGEIRKVFYPVFPPEQNAADVLAWLRENLL